MSTVSTAAALKEEHEHSVRLEEIRAICEELMFANSKPGLSVVDKKQNADDAVAKVKLSLKRKPTLVLLNCWYERPRVATLHHGTVEYYRVTGALLRAMEMNADVVIINIADQKDSKAVFEMMPSAMARLMSDEQIRQAREKAEKTLACMAETNRLYQLYYAGGKRVPASQVKSFEIYDC